MIPRVIHYCWFGGRPLPDLAEQCIASWKKFCPDYEIIRWDETNFDLTTYPYAKEAYDNKKYAFVSDVARLYALVNYGGIYMDTDVEVIKPLDIFLDCNAFSGFESSNAIPTGIMACEKKHSLFAEFLDEYKEIHFVKQDGTLDLITNVERITRICQRYGLKTGGEKQVIRDFVIYPADYFCPKNWKTRELVVTKNTYAIHHFNGSWLDERTYYYNHCKDSILTFFPCLMADCFANILTCMKYDGITTLFQKVFKKLYSSCRSWYKSKFK